MSGERRRVGVEADVSDGDPFRVDGFSGVDDVYDRALERVVSGHRQKWSVRCGNSKPRATEATTSCRR